jgi:malonyl-CoA/methylmalonyl-CoA synthetase
VNVYELLIDGALDADRVALHDLAGTTWSYRALSRETARIANALIAAGVQPGDRVAIYAEKRAAIVAVYLACLRAGAVVLPLNTAYTSHELDYLLGDASPALVVCDAATEAVLRSTGSARPHLTIGPDGGSLLALAERQPDRFTTVAREDDDLAALLYTSGTTGRPKGAMLTHGNLASNARSLASTWQMTVDDVLIHALPLFHTHGLLIAMNTLLIANGTIVLLDRFAPKAVIDLMSRSTVLMGVPTFYTRLLAEPRLSRSATRHMRLFVSGSAPLLPATHSAWMQRTGHALLERYGLTETGVNTSNPADGPRIAGSVGLPLDNVEVRITAMESSTPVAPGEIGRITVRGPNVFKGYWGMPDATAEAFDDAGFFITGDLGTIDEQGYLHIVGREKDLIISGGFNVYPKEVEAELDGMPGIAESAVIGLPHADFGEAVTAVVVQATNDGLDEDVVREQLATRLARYKVPKRVITVPQLPRNALGKIEKRTLRETYADLYRQVD